MAKRWDESFIDAFGQSFAMGQQMLQQQLLNRNRQIQLDVHMYKNGFDRLENPDEIKQVLKEQYVKGYKVAGGGAVGTPPGTKVSSGVMTDEQGNTVGEYAPGSEPTPVSNFVGAVGPKVIKVGDLFYKARENKISPTEIQDKVDELNARFNTGGQWVPAWTDTQTGKTSYRFSVTPKAKGTDAVTGALLSGAPLPQKVIKAPVKTYSPQVTQMRQNVSNAINQKATLEEIFQGLVDEKYNPADFQDLLEPLVIQRQRASQQVVTPQVRTSQAVSMAQYRRNR